MHSSGGIYIGHRLALKVDAERVIRTADRIVRGLFPKFFGEVLPSSYDAAAVLFDLQKDDSALVHPDVQDALGYLHDVGVHHQFGDVLDIRAACVEDDRFSSMWLVRLHGAFGFIGYTSPKGA